jgi:two-component system response regulator NreC
MEDTDKKIKVLIADDHPIIRDGLNCLLSCNPSYTVVAIANDGAQALKDIKEHKPDIVFMDITMPLMNGLEATKKIKKDFPETKVIIFTMHTEKHIAMNAFRAGAKGYLLKNAEDAVILEAIKQVMDGNLYASPSIANKIFTGVVDKIQSDQPIEPFETLTEREKEVLKLMAKGVKNKEIAEQLFISIHTVKTHRVHIMNKLDIHNLAGLTKVAIRKGLISG